MTRLSDIEWIQADAQTPDPLTDVLAMRSNPFDDTPVPDICFYGTDSRWHSSTECGEIMDAPLGWLPIPGFGAA